MTETTETTRKETLLYAISNTVHRKYYGLFRGTSPENSLVEYAAFVRVDLSVVEGEWHRGELRMELAEVDSGFEFWPADAKKSYIRGGGKRTTKTSFHPHPTA